MSIINIFVWYSKNQVSINILDVFLLWNACNNKEKIKSLIGVIAKKRSLFKGFFNVLKIKFLLFYIRICQRIKNLKM